MRYNASVGILDSNCRLDVFRTFSAFDLRVYGNVGVVCIGRKRAEERFPRVNADVASEDQPDGTIESGTRIPPTAFLDVVESHRDFIVLASEQLRNVESESIITIVPTACFLSVYIHNGFAHSPIEVEFGSFCTFWNRENRSISTLTEPGKSPRTASMIDGFVLSVLCYGKVLNIPFPVEWAVDSPVVRYTDLLPYLSVA